MKGPMLVRVNGNIVNEVEMLELIFTTAESFPRPVALRKFGSLKSSRESASSHFIPKHCFALLLLLGNL